MPPLPNVPNGIKVEFQGVQNLIPWANVMHLKNNGGTISGPNMTALATALHGYYVARFLPSMSSNVTLQSCSVIDISSITGIGARFNANQNGGQGGNTTGQQAAWVLGWNIARRYRGGRPRTYLPGIPVSAIQDARSLSNTALGVMQTALQNFIADILTNTSLGIAGTVGLACVHYRGNPAGGPYPTIDLITGGTARALYGTQRRRIGR
jgi:hypothetical protein